MLESLTIDPDLMNDQIKCLITQINQELTKTEKRERSLRAAKLCLQAVCNHEFAPDGHTHGGQYETCHICGFTQR
jgi:hypothetical protein